MGGSKESSAASITPPHPPLQGRYPDRALPGHRSLPSISLRCTNARSSTSPSNQRGMVAFNDSDHHLVRVHPGGPGEPGASSRRRTIQPRRARL